MKKLLIALFAISIFASCEKDTPAPVVPPGPIIPSASFEVDSILHNIDTTRMYASCTQLDGITFSFAANDSQAIYVDINSANGNDTIIGETFNLVSDKVSSDGPWGKWGGSYSSNCNPTNNPGFTNGRVTFTKFDKTNKRISGEFYFDACFFGTIVHIRKGKFENISMTVL